MRAMMGLALLNEHPDDDPEEPRQFWHRVTLQQGVDSVSQTIHDELREGLSPPAAAELVDLLVRSSGCFQKCVTGIARRHSLDAGLG